MTKKALVYTVPQLRHISRQGKHHLLCYDGSTATGGAGSCLVGPSATQDICEDGYGAISNCDYVGLTAFDNCVVGDHVGSPNWCVVGSVAHDCGAGVTTG